MAEGESQKNRDARGLPQQKPPGPPPGPGLRFSDIAQAEGHQDQSQDEPPPDGPPVAVAEQCSRGDGQAQEDPEAGFGKIDPPVRAGHGWLFSPATKSGFFPSAIQRNERNCRGRGGTATETIARATDRPTKSISSHPAALAALQKMMASQP